MRAKPLHMGPLGFILIIVGSILGASLAPGLTPYISPNAFTPVFITPLLQGIFAGILLHTVYPWSLKNSLFAAVMAVLISIMWTMPFFRGVFPRSEDDAIGALQFMPFLYYAIFLPVMFVASLVTISLSALLLHSFRKALDTPPPVEVIDSSSQALDLTPESQGVASDAMISSSQPLHGPHSTTTPVTYPSRPGLSPFAAALLGSILGAILGLAMATLSISLLETYGWGLFIFTPIIQGFIAGYFVYNKGNTVRPAHFLVAILTIAITALGILAFNLDGLICVIMAAPIAIPLVLLGSLLGYSFRGMVCRWGHKAPHYALSLWVLAPALAAIEARYPQAPPLLTVTSEVTIAATPKKIWDLVIAFPPLDRPTEPLFQTGIAYPRSARVEGTGPGAIRYCEFSTGPFIEPITTWDAPHHLAFTVKQQPPVMEELAVFHTHVHPPHLEHSLLKSQRGEFRLIPQADGTTLLRGTTWYTNQMWPAPYWALWSDYIIHKIHLRVLTHIKTLAET